MERYRITVELEGNASPESFKLVEKMARTLLEVTATEWDDDNSILTLRVKRLRGEE